VPWAKRPAYLPRTPPEKSYSGRSSSRTRFDLGARVVLLAFFIPVPFPTAGGSSADDSNGIAALHMGDHHEMVASRATDQDEPFLRCRVVWVGNRD